MPATCRARVPLILALMPLAIGLPAPLRAEQVVAKRARFAVDGAMVHLTVGFREMLDPPLRARLRNGFATTVVMKAYVYRTGKQTPVAMQARTLRATYDLWEERFLLRATDARGTRLVRLSDQGMLVDRLTSLWRFPLFTVKQLTVGKYYFVAVLVEVNPLSPDVLAEVRSWLRRPYRRPRGSTGESFFGSFVSIFVNDKVSRAEKTFKVRTQPFYWQP